MGEQPQWGRARRYAGQGSRRTTATRRELQAAAKVPIPLDLAVHTIDDLGADVRDLGAKVGESDVHVAAKRCTERVEVVLRRDVVPGDRW
jgi:hypothetical protein